MSDEDVKKEIAELRQRLEAILQHLAGPDPPTDRSTQTDGATPHKNDEAVLRLLLMDREHDVHLNRLKTETLIRQIAVLEKENKNLVEVTQRLRQQQNSNSLIIQQRDVLNVPAGRNESIWLPGEQPSAVPPSQGLAHPTAPTKDLSTRETCNLTTLET